MDEPQGPAPSANEPEVPAEPSIEKALEHLAQDMMSAADRKAEAWTAEPVPPEPDPDEIAALTCPDCHCAFLVTAALQAEQPLTNYLRCAKCWHVVKTARAAAILRGFKIGI